MVNVNLDRIIGQKFGKLTVIDCYHKDSSRKQIICKVQCDCGSEPRELPLYQLASGNTKSCGCSRVRKKKNIVGMQMGQLMITEEHEDGSGKVHCDCGYSWTVPNIRGRISSLKKKGMCKNCIKKTKRVKFDDIEPGTKFGRLTVVRRLENIKETGEAQYLCKCACGNFTTVRGKFLGRGTTKSCGCLRGRGVRPDFNFADIKSTFAGKKLYNIWRYYIYREKTVEGYKVVKFFPEWAGKPQKDFRAFYEWALSCEPSFDPIKRDKLKRYDETADYSPENCYFSNK